jgi:hypothetical protein
MRFFQCVGVINRRRGISEVVEVDETRVSSLGGNAPSQDGKAIILDKDRPVSSAIPRVQTLKRGDIGISLMTPFQSLTSTSH